LYDNAKACCVESPVLGADSSHRVAHPPEGTCATSVMHCIEGMRRTSPRYYQDAKLRSKDSDHTRQRWSRVLQTSAWRMTWACKLGSERATSQLRGPRIDHKEPNLNNNYRAKSYFDSALASFVMKQQRVGHAVLNSRARCTVS
jgi:hypothetical protein